MKYYIVTMLLWVGVIQVFAQQPRLKQVDEYLAATGQTVELRAVRSICRSFRAVCTWR